MKALCKCQGVEWDAFFVVFLFSSVGTQKDNGWPRIKELAVKLKSAYFRGLISPWRNWAAANIILLSAIVETAMTLGTSNYLCENWGNAFNSVHKMGLTPFL